MAPEATKFTNGSRNGKISIVVGIMLLSAAVGVSTSYFTGRLAISKDLGDRPSRIEVERKIDKAQTQVKEYTDAQQKAIMHQLSSLKGDVNRLQSTLNQVLLQLRNR